MPSSGPQNRRPEPLWTQSHPALHAGRGATSHQWRRGTPADNAALPRSWPKEHLIHEHVLWQSSAVSMCGRPLFHMQCDTQGSSGAALISLGAAHTPSWIVSCTSWICSFAETEPRRD